MRNYRQSKQSFFHLGVVNQKSPDIVFDFKRIGEHKMEKWSKSEKKEVLKWLKHCEVIFKEFKKDITKAAKIGQIV